MMFSPDFVLAHADHFKDASEKDASDASETETAKSDESLPADGSPSADSTTEQTVPLAETTSSLEVSAPAGAEAGGFAFGLGEVLLGLIVLGPVVLFAARSKTRSLRG
ncbi:MAG: hypothetical protein AAFO84_11355 [Cyanobacteria bacterium J06598_1]